MRNLADELDYAFFNRDADNVDASDAVVLFGMEEVRRGLDAGCQYCHFESCADCTEKDGLCAWDAIDIGIAIGSAAAAAADARVDSRVMFSVGRAAKSLGLLGENAGGASAPMLNDFTGADKVYIACGYTDLRKGIDGLARLVQQQFELDSFTNTLFLFCGRRRDRIKGLYWEKDGFILLYKRLEQGAYQWPRSESEVKVLTPQQYRWLMEGLKIEQPKAHRPVTGLTTV